MNITLTVNRILRKDELQEIFQWNPKTRYYYDDTRVLEKQIKILIAQMSLHNKKTNIKLKDIKYFIDSIVYYYNIIENNFDDIENFEEYKFQYFPSLGRKTCKNCRHLKIWNNQYICLLRCTPYKKFAGCWDWEETQYQEREKNVYRQNTTRRNGRTNK